MNPDDRAIAIAERIADGSAVDWTLADSGGTNPGERNIFEQLKSIAALAALHREPTGWPAEAIDAESLRWGPLALRSKIGEGRYGQVYLAWDARLQRRVALKLLLAAPSVAASSPGHAIEEARLLAKIRHPNVLAVHGAECVDNQVGIWTEFIEGRTLEALLAERGPMPPDEVAAIGLDLCRALGAVHDVGLLHRDVKAQNVMREIGGRIVLMDFGTGHDLNDKPARPGDLSGTPLYLAPEILDGREATAASDVYALSVLLFRLLTGDYPVPGRTLDDVRKGHREGVAARLGGAGSVLPTGLIEAINRGLEPDPAKRYASAAAFGDALARVVTPARVDVEPGAGAKASRRSWWRVAAAAAVLVVLSSVGVWQWIATHPRPAQWVLVADFENATGDPLYDGFAHYLLEPELANSTSVHVVSRERIDDILRLMKVPVDSVLSRERSLEVALRDGEVNAVVTGTIERTEAGYFLTANVVAPKTGEMLANVPRPARPASDLNAAVRQLANDLRGRFGENQAVVDDGTRRLERVTTSSIQALKSYTQAHDLGVRNQWDASLELARLAVAEDPSFASAWIWLAWTLRNTDQEDEALAAARQAVTLSSGASGWEKYWIRGSAHYIAKEWDQSITQYQALLALVPGHRWAVNNLTRLTGDGRYFVKLAELLPRDWDAQFGAARHLYILGASDADVEYHWNRGASIDRTPKFPFIPAMLRLNGGDPRAASHEIKKQVDRWATSNAVGRDHITFTLDVVWHRLALGQLEAARQFVQAQQLPEPTRVSLMAILDFYSGRTEEARAALEHFEFESAPLPRSTLIGVMTDLGLSSQAETILSIVKWDTPAIAWGEGGIALGRGDFNRALGLLEPALPELATAQRQSLAMAAAEQFYRASLTVANAWVRKEETGKAAATLRAALDRQIRPFQGSELARLNVIARLAVLERRLGRAREGDALDAKLRHALQMADPVFVNQLIRLAER